MTELVVVVKGAGGGFWVLSAGSRLMTGWDGGDDVRTSAPNQRSDPDQEPSFQPQIWISATCGTLSSTDELQLSKCLNPDDPGTI